MNKRFETFYPIMMSFEMGKLVNGYVNDKDDSGGETVMGVCRKFHPNLKVWKSLDACKGVVAKRGYHLTNEEIEEVKAVYKKNYYDAVNADKINDEPLAMQLFDFAVNAGKVRAVKTLQSILHITADGICGLQTVTTANNTKPKALREAYRKARMDYYNACAKKGNNSKFLKGWLRRAQDCDKEIIAKI